MNHLVFKRVRIFKLEPSLAVLIDFPIDRSPLNTQPAFGVDRNFETVAITHPFKCVDWPVVDLEIVDTFGRMIIRLSDSSISPRF